MAAARCRGIRSNRAWLDFKAVSTQIVLSNRLEESRTPNPSVCLCPSTPSDNFLGGRRLTQQRSEMSFASLHPPLPWYVYTAHFFLYSRWAPLLSCLWSLRIFPFLPGSRLTDFYRDTSSALLQLVNQWLTFTFSRTNTFRYGRHNKNYARQKSNSRLPH